MKDLIFLFLLISFFSSSIMAPLCFGSLNINGRRDAVKRSSLFDYIIMKNGSVVFLQETHTDLSNQTQWQSEWIGKVVLSHGSSSSAGVAILFGSEFKEQNVSVFDLLPGRMQRVDVTLHGLNFSLFNVYAPNIGTERTLFFGKLNTALTSVPQGRIIVLAGDFNCTLDHTLDRNHEEPHSHSAEAFRKLIIYYDFVDVWREAFPNIKQYTWLKVNSNMVSAARLDRIYVQRSASEKFHNSCITPTSLSDHHYMSVTVTSAQSTFKCPYWRFSNRLLQDHNFVHAFTLFWEEWRERKTQYKSLSQWWDIGKVQVKLFCQKYSAHNRSILENQMRQLEQDILQLNIEENDESTAEVLETRKILLRNLLEEKAKETLIRARFMSFNCMDSSSSFFFNLEKKSADRKTFSCMKLPEGGETTEEHEIIAYALKFYENLYRAEPCDGEITDTLLRDLPHLTAEDNSKLDQPLHMNELTTAIKDLSSGKAPGLDGLTAEFYKQFWPVIGKDLFSVFLECFDRGTLPVSLRRAAITLLPKKGDLRDIRNWRPVSLHGIDYKILSKALTNRLKLYISKLIHADQSYCIPKRTIFDNLFLMRDLISFARDNNLNVGLLSLDQEKAFDRVDHGFLFKCFEAFGFGSSFISYVKLLYTDIYSILKINGSLTRPFSINRGIRQGCSMSGILYAIAIEPLLTVLRRQLGGISTVGPSTSEMVTVKLSAYADDVTVIIRSNEDVCNLETALEIYQKASSARINWQKSTSLLLGKWEERACPKLPQHCSWSLEGFKVLGIFLGTEQYMRKNWEGLYEKVAGRLQKWRWILPQLSYRGRVLVVNNLAASMLWHRLTVIDPPKELLQNLQKVFVDFFWDGFHWLPSGILYLPVNEGGQGLIELSAKVKAMRLKSAQRLLFSTEFIPWVSFGLALLKSICGVELDKQLFLMSPINENVSSEVNFYASVLKSWNVFKLYRSENDHYGLDEPLFFNPFLGNICMSNSVVKSCMKKGFSKVGHLIDLVSKKWRSAEDIARQVDLKSVRVVEQLISGLKAAFPPPLFQFLICALEDGPIQLAFPKLSVSPEVCYETNQVGKLLQFERLEGLNFQTAGEKDISGLCKNYLF